MIIRTALRNGFSESHEVVDKLRVMLMATMETLFGESGSTAYAHEDGYSLESPEREGKCQACGGRGFGVLKYRKHTICPSCKRAWLTKEKSCGTIKSWDNFCKGGR